MSWTPLINDEPYTFTSSDLPALIHGEKHSGSSLFSLAVLAQFYFQGDPLLLISPSNQTKDEFIELIGKDSEFVEILSSEDISRAVTSQVICVSHEHESLLPSLLASVEDKDERIVLLTSMESLTSETLKLFYTHPHTVFSGDLNTSSEKEPLLQLKYNAKIFFSPLHNDFRLTLPLLEKYHAYYQGRTSQGTVYLIESQPLQG